MNDEYQTQYFWSMKRSELKQIIKEEIRNILENEDPTNVGMKKAVGFKEPTGPRKTKIVPAKEKKYEVSFWYRHGKGGDEKDNKTIKVEASTEEEAIKKAKDHGVPRTAYSFEAKEIN